MNFSIINASEKDLEYIRKIIKANIMEFAEELSDKDLNDISIHVNKDSKKYLNSFKILVAENKIIGCFSVLKTEDGILLNEIYIEEEYRKKGIATSVIKTILKEEQHICLWVYKGNNPAISLYKKLGFKIVDETKIRYFMKY